MGKTIQEEYDELMRQLGVLEPRAESGGLIHKEVVDIDDSFNIEDNPITPDGKIIIALDAQRLNSFQTCEQRYYLRHQENIDSSDLPYYIEMGLLMHDLLKFYYSQIVAGADRADAIKFALREGKIKALQYSIEEDQKNVVYATFAEYLEFYINDLLIPKLIEQPFSVKIYEDKKIIVLWEGIMDFFGENAITKASHPMDHKTSQRKNYAHIMDNQFIGYCVASESDILVVNHIIFKKGDDKFRREVLNCTDKIKENWLDNVPDFAYQILDCANKGKWPMRQHSCNAMYGCKMRNYCSANQPYREWLLKTQYKTVKPWDPFTRD